MTGIIRANTPPPITVTHPELGSQLNIFSSFNPARPSNSNISSNKAKKYFNPLFA